MNVSTQQDFEYLVKRVFDDLVDECTLKEKILRNGSRVAAKSLIKDALRMKIEFLEELKKLQVSPDTQTRSKQFRALSNNVARQSMSIVDRMSDLGL
jgi:hypothetical protein